MNLGKYHDFFRSDIHSANREHLFDGGLFANQFLKPVEHLRRQGSPHEKLCEWMGQRKRGNCQQDTNGKRCDAVWNVGFENMTEKKSGGGNRDADESC